MKNTSIKRQSSHMLAVNREICQNLYNEKGQAAVYDYCNKIKMSYSYCRNCETNTPVLMDRTICECAICGSNMSEDLKTYGIQYNIAKAKYVVVYKDPTKKHSDGSQFYDHAVFSNKQKRDKFISELIKQGYNEK